PQFTQARITLAILAVTQLFNVGSGVVGALLIMTRHEGDMCRAIAAAAVTNIALTFLLVPRWGAEGAAVSFGIGMVVWNVWAIIALWRKAGLHSTALGKLTLRRTVPIAG